jgi:hypothetical protein
MTVTSALFGWAFSWGPFEQPAAAANNRMIAAGYAMTL